MRAAPCHARPREDARVIEEVGHVPLRAGCAVFWDQRIPHANARFNRGPAAREVIYGGWLPRVARSPAFLDCARARAAPFPS